MIDFLVQTIPGIWSQPISPSAAALTRAGVSPAQEVFDGQFQMDMTLPPLTEVNAVELTEGAALVVDGQVAGHQLYLWVLPQEELP